MECKKRNFGLPYKGSKNKIARDIIEFLPAAHTFYDLFCGGCAITDCALESGKYKEFVINDIDPKLPQFYLDAVNGKFRNEKRIIDRDTFNRLKDTDPVISACWSFGNNCREYLWTDEIAIPKLLACNMIAADTLEERRQYYLKFIGWLKKHLGGWRADLHRLHGLERLERIKEIERVQELECFERLNRLKALEETEKAAQIRAFSGDYQEVPIAADNAVIYCDIPYRKTDEYNGRAAVFDYERFYQWAHEQKNPVFISEYAMPADLFECVWQKEKVSKFSDRASKVTVEKIFIPKGQNQKGGEKALIDNSYHGEQLVFDFGKA